MFVSSDFIGPIEKKKHPAQKISKYLLDPDT